MDVKSKDIRYAGIGSRETPVWVLGLMHSFGKMAARKNWILYTGNAVGADQAFMSGCKESSGQAKIFLPWPGYEGKNLISCHDLPWKIFTKVGIDALKIAEENHPSWNNCSNGAKSLHGRNSYIALGEDLNNPVDFCICYTKDGKINGGTGQALRIINNMCPNTEVINIGRYGISDKEIVINIFKSILNDN